MEKIKFGIVGLGRLGIQHAENIAFGIPETELLAVCSLDEAALAKVKNEWNIKYLYEDYDDMIKNRELDAIFICSPSGLHCEQIEKALKKGFHVFSEKPLGITLEECTKVEKVVEKYAENQVFMLGFMRRFDPSYKYAKDMIEAGKIGKPFLFRGYSQDSENCIGGAIAYAGHSGGEFIDMSVHDIDLARWFLNSEPKEVWAIGGCYKHQEFKKYDDGDNVSALMKFENDTMAFLFAGRTAPHGYNVETEIIGTEGILRIGSVPQKNLVEIFDNNGIRKECSQNFLERFNQAYLSEVKAFVRCILEKRRPELSVYDGTKVTKIAHACKESFGTGKLVKL